MVRITARTLMCKVISILCIFLIAFTTSGAGAANQTSGDGSGSTSHTNDCGDIDAAANNLNTPNCDGNICTLSCKQNYRITNRTDKALVTCTDGTWNPLIPTCEAITCPPWELLDNQIYTRGDCTAIRKVGDSCDIDCKPGYEFTKLSTRNDGTHYKRACITGDNKLSPTWSRPRTPECKVICPPLEIENNQRFTNDGGCTGNRNVNTDCKIACNKNYKFTSDPSNRVRTLQCQLNDDTQSADWSPGPSSIPECEEITCPPLEIKNNQIFTNDGCTGDRNVNTECTIACNVNYKFTSDPLTRGRRTLRCQLNDATQSAYWSPRLSSIPECEAIKCPAKKLGSNQIYKTGNCTETRNVGDSCKVICRQNFKFHSGRSVANLECTLDGDALSASWSLSSIPQCIAYECPKLSLHTFKNYTRKSCPGGKTVGSECPVSCKDGYRFNDETSVANIRCVLTETASGKSALWDTDNAPACKLITCSEASLPNHLYTKTSCPADKEIGSKCWIRCKPGYTVTSTKIGGSIICVRKLTNELEAEWKVENAPICKEITCSNIAERENLNKVNGKCGNSIDTTCDIQCREHYKFPSPWETEDTLRTKCVLTNIEPQTTADWKTERSRPTRLDPTPGSCEEIRCPETKMKGNYRNTTCESASINSLCMLQCKNGYKFSDKSIVKQVSCTLNRQQKTATWPTPVCKEVKCERVNSSSFNAMGDNFKEKRHRLGTDCRQGSECSLSCAAGYYTSTNSLTCNKTSEKWTPRPSNVGLCKPIIRRKNKCEYWESGIRMKSNVSADNHCRQVLGPTAALAMPKHPKKDIGGWFGTLTSPTLVGGYVSGGVPRWNDGTKVTGLSKTWSGSPCLILWKSLFYGVTCGSKSYKFLCERPGRNRNPCSDRICGSGTCTAVGCSFRCTCPDLIYGRRCQKGPFTKNITELTKGRFQVYFKNNAIKETAKMSVFLNGKEIKSTDVKDGEAVDEIHSLNPEERHNFISLVVSLVNRPDVTQSECLIVTNSTGRDRVNITNDKCDPTVLKVWWDGFSGNSENPTNYSVYISKKWKASSQAGRRITISGLKREKYYNIRVVPSIEGCNIVSDFEVRNVSTSYGASDPAVIGTPRLVSDKASTKNCTIDWTPDRPENSAGYEMKLIQEARFVDGVVPPVTQTEDLPQFTKSFSFRTKPNSIYRLSVGTKAPVGCDNVELKWSNEVSGCETGTSAPEAISADLITVSPNSNGSVVTLKQVNERNGPVSCYLVIVRVVNSVLNSSKVATTIEELKQVNDTVNAGDSYIAIAVKRFEGTRSLSLGNRHTSCCNIRNSSEPCQSFSGQTRQKRAVSPTDEVRGENRRLDADTKYQHYAFIATPRSDGNDPILTATPLSDSWTIPKERPVEPSSSNPIAIVIPVVIVILLIIVIAGFTIYRRRSREPKKQLRPSPRVKRESLSVEAGEFIDMVENAESIIDRELAGFTLRLSDLFRAINTKRENDDMQFLQEFKKSIPDAVKQCDLTYEIAHLRVNQPKNRFKNIVPYDRSRVSLTNVPGIEFSDYVNASYIDGYSYPQKFIATQGPKPETIEDFWRMVLEQNCRVIVMLTKLKERMKIKCAQYWPDEGVTQDHNGIKVTLHETISFGDFLQRRIVVTRKNESVDITQFHFVAWPDHGVPSTTSSLLRFHDYVVNAQPSNAGPIIVHCSAGVGRTGTFICLNHLNDQIMKMNEINVAVIIGRMRTRRPEMVQTLDQYILIHKLVLELYQFGVTDKDISEFNSAIQELKRGTLNIAQEFEMLNYFMPLDTSQDYARKQVNSRMNRNPSILPYDHNRAFIQMEPNDREVPYYNASIVASYDPSNQCIAAQSPDEQSVEVFWRMVLNNDVNVLVALEASNEADMQVYWPDVSKSETYGMVTVRTFEEKTEKGLTERVLEVSTKTKKISLLHICFDGWPDHGVPSGSEAVLEITSKIEKHFQTLSQQDKKTTLVHCSDGAGRTGAFFAISNLIERLKNENRVDVFRMAKDLRDLRPGMIETADQYTFCYQAVSDYLQLFDLYGNFQ